MTLIATSSIGHLANLTLMMFRMAVMFNMHIPPSPYQRGRLTSQLPAARYTRALMLRERDELNAARALIDWGFIVSCAVIGASIVIGCYIH